jgi:hypothetical protein
MEKSSQRAGGTNMADEGTMRSVRWENEQAQRADGTKVACTVILWDDEAKAGKAVIAGEGIVDVYVTSYALGDLTIGQKQ